MIDDFKQIKLGDIAEFQTGPFGTQLKASEYSEDGIPIINVKNIGYGAILDNDLDRVPNTVCDRLSTHILREEDIVFGRKGSIDRHGYIGKMQDGWMQGSDCIRMRITSKDFIPRFVSYCLNLSMVKAQIKNASVGSTMDSLNTDILRNVKIPFVSQNKQSLIVAFLSDIDAKIDNNNAICADLEGMAKLLYDYWFVQFDFPDKNGKPYKSSGGKMVWNEELKREIPEGWEVIRLGDYITADRGISYNSTTLEGNGVPMINLASFNVDSTYKASGLKTYSGAYGKEQVLRPYDLVMCNTQQTAIDPAKDIIGKTLLVPDIFDGDIVSSHHVTSIHVADDAFKYYLNAESKTAWFHKYVAGFASGTNILGLDFNGVLNYKMPMPPEEIMSKFASMSHSSEARKNEIIRENADLVGLRDFLLPMLMNGQVKVKGA